MVLKKQNDPHSMLFPLPEYLQAHYGRVSNFGLYFQKFCRYHRDEKRNNNKLELKNQAKHSSVLKTSQPHLNAAHDRQSRYLEDLSRLGSGILEISAKSTTPLLTGIGETSPTEVGMLFDRNMGIPYLPASSVKGAVRYAFCVNFAQKEPDKVRGGTVQEGDVRGLVELFGSSDTNNSYRGGFAFMDTFAEQTPELTTDIMNPHHGDYYKNQSPQGPVEIESPIPIKFLTVKKGGEYKFRGFFLNQKAEGFRKELLEAYYTALTLLGLGAKTAVGYGRFDNIEETTDSLIKIVGDRREQEDKKRQEEEKARKLAEQKAENEIRKKERAAAKEQEDRAYKENLENAEGIDKYILMLQREGDFEENEQIALDCYDQYLKSLKSLGDKQREAGQLVMKQFKKWKKKTRKSKLKRRDHLNKLLRKK